MAEPLILRRARPEDGAGVADIYAHHVRDTIVTFETEAPDAAEMAARIAGRIAADLPWIVAEGKEGGVSGYAYAAPFHPRHAYRFTVEPTIYLAEDAHGRGVGRALYERLFAILTEQGYRQAVALISLPNAASVALHERLGFRHTGTHRQVGHKLGRWIDVGLWQREIGAGEGPLIDHDPAPLTSSDNWTTLP